MAVGYEGGERTEYMQASGGGTNKTPRVAAEWGASRHASRWH